MKKQWWQYALAAVLALLVLWLLAGILSSRPPDAELVRTVREALQMARQAYQEADAVRKGSSAFRLIAMVVGMAGPLIVAYLIYKLHLDSGPQSPGMLDQAERQLIEPVENGQKELPPPALRLPEETTEVEKVDQD